MKKILMLAMVLGFLSGCGGYWHKSNISKEILQLDYGECKGNKSCMKDRGYRWTHVGSWHEGDTWAYHYGNNDWHKYENKR